jgi:hyperosmotically inducible periplasmic protein
MDTMEEHVIDERIKRDIVEQLYWDDRIDASRITVEVVDGKVVLGGIAHSPVSRDAAERDAWLIPGVREVSNQIRIEWVGLAGTPSDDEIQRSVVALLTLSGSLEEQTIHSSVHNGTVVLTGTVDANWKKIRAEELVSDVLGVRWVKNELAVVPSRKLSDRAIAESLVAALERNVHIDMERIDISVDEGRVTISGMVLTPAAYWASYRTALFNPGVRAVVNNLTIMESSELDL